MEKKVYIRADGDNQIGLGHLVRCIALGQMLLIDFEISFFCLECPAKLVTEIESLGFSLTKIRTDDEFLKLLTGDEIVVLDHYQLASSFQKLVKETGCKLVCIDDIHEKHFYADLIVNTAPGINASDYNAETYTQFALGLNYALLRPPFLKSWVNKSHKKETSIMVCFGGSDSRNLTQTVVEVLKKDLRFSLVNIIIGAGYNNPVMLSESIKNDERFKLFISVNASQMAEIIQESALAIVPSSGILSEVLALNTPAISGFYVQNQINVFNNFKKLNAFISAEGFSADSIINSIEEYFNEVKNPSIPVIDGKSGDRVLNCFRQLWLEKDVVLKYAEEKDLTQTYKWASDNAMRKFFFNAKPITLEEHSSWFLNKIKDHNCVYLLGILNGKCFGSLRFEKDIDDAIISFVIDPAYQSKGLGTILLKLGINFLTSDCRFKGVVAVKAEVLCGNTSSLKVFRKLGYNESMSHDKSICHFAKAI
jgi:UDP-2,4-diacetamido-2,4,6-trideoxy-beta-L-altropyranose hydrolase